MPRKMYKRNLSIDTARPTMGSFLIPRLNVNIEGSRRAGTAMDKSV